MLASDESYSLVSTVDENSGSASEQMIPGISSFSHDEIALQQRKPYIQLVVRQQPSKARMCSFKEKVDRRPVDPPPIVQLVVQDDVDPYKGNQAFSQYWRDYYLNNPNVFMYATLINAATGEDMNHTANGTRTTVGGVVQSLHKLKDIDNTDGGFFVFGDINVRLEGTFKLRFTLYEIVRVHVYCIISVLSDTFRVYPPKAFPGMSESTSLTRCFSEQGVRIRIRKGSQAGPSSEKRPSWEQPMSFLPQPPTLLPQIKKTKTKEDQAQDSHAPFTQQQTHIILPSAKELFAYASQAPRPEDVSTSRTGFQRFHFNSY